MPPSGISGSRELDALWLEHLRWFNEEATRRATSAEQARYALLGFVGVLIALLTPVVLDATGPGRWLMFLSLLILAVAAGLLAWSARPLPIATPSIEWHRERFRQLKTEARVPGLLTGFMIEDILKVRDDAGSQITQRNTLNERRGVFYRWALALVMMAVAFLVTGVFVQIAQ